MSDINHDDESKSVKIVEGAKDILPKDHQFFTYFKKVIRHRCRQAGYRRFTTPILETQEFIKKSLNNKCENLANHFCTKTKTGEDVCLVSDRTPSLFRAYYDNNMSLLPQPVELYYVEPVFNVHNFEHTYIQSNTFGISVMGEIDEAIDAQVMHLILLILEDFGIRKSFKLTVNNVGSFDEQKIYAQALQDFYIGKERSLCEECNKNLYIKPLRLLSCCFEDCKILAALAPKYEQFLSDISKEYFEKVKEFLKELNIEFEINEKLFLPYDYYTNIVFALDGIGKIKETLCYGGRCDAMSKILGYENHIPGFASTLNVDVLIASMRKAKIYVPSKDDLHVFLAQIGDEAKKKCLKLIDSLRESGIKCLGGLGKGSMKYQLHLAQQFKVPYTVLMGITEVKEGVAIIRDMQRGIQHKVPYEDVVKTMVELIGDKNLDKYHPGELLYS
jgi:histidyl-tRNA synthetase